MLPLWEIGVEFPTVLVDVSEPGEVDPRVTRFNPRRGKVGRGPGLVECNAALGMPVVLDHAVEVTRHD